MLFNYQTVKVVCVWSNYLVLCYMTSSYLVCGARSHSIMYKCQIYYLFAWLNIQNHLLHHKLISTNVSCLPRLSVTLHCLHRSIISILCKYTNGVYSLKPNVSKLSESFTRWLGAWVVYMVTRCLVVYMVTRCLGCL